MSLEQTSWLILAIVAALPIVLLTLWLKAKNRANSAEAQRDVQRDKTARLEGEKARLIEALEGIERRFRPVIDIDEELASVKEQHRAASSEFETLRADYATKKEIYDRLKSEVAIFDEKLSFAELGIYEPHFEFTDSEQFKDEIREVRDRQKDVVSNKKAIIANEMWRVDGSASKGQTMINRAVRLSLRAFNNECDAATSNARWNNVQAMEKRIERARTQIDKLNKSMMIEISGDYYWLKMKELRLTHEYREKQKEERDHKVEMRRLQREEERLLKDAAVAEKEEERYQKLLDKAKAEAQAAIGPNVAEFESRIAELSRELELAHQKVERAKSMAEQTRAGHIYIISNVGSFGDKIYKIGMTRRLEPSDRVRELGDASVPFLFDTHAMIYSEDAPAMERALHEAFDDRRVNLVNTRKEFFEVSLDEIRAEVQKITPDAEFITGIEAQQYHETLALIRQREAEKMNKEDEFPASL